MNRTLFIKKLIVSTIALVSSAVALSAHAYSGEKFSKKAKITIHEARATALKTYAGEIVAEELEREKGGSGLRYSFDIRRDQVTQEVGVDANTGNVLENAPEGTNPD